MSYCPFCMNELREGESKCSACGRELSEYVSPSHTLAQGAMLNHRYLVGGVLGEGGFGITYIGLDTLLQFKVAIKEFYPAGMVNRNNTVSNEVLSISADTARELFSKSREHFLHEARTLAKFTNEPGIVAVRDFFEENHTVYIVMEYLDGITLKSYLKQVGTISSYNTICLLMPVFQSLKKIHEKNLIHRDISPDNIMLVGEAVKLLDFGAAREFADEKSLSVMLKHGYAPMEQYRRHGKQGAWTDIYAICATVYKCITGNIPPDAPDRIYEDNLKMPSELGFECSPEFEAVLRHGLAIKAEDRIQSIDQLLDELSKVPDFDLGFDSGTAPAPIMPENKGGSNTAASPSDGEGPRLSQYVPRSSYEDNESTVYTPKPNFTAAENTDSTDSDARLSEYIPTSSSEPEPEPEPKKPEPAPAPAIPEKKSSKLIIVGAACAALLVIGGIVLFMNLKGDDSVKTSSPDSTAAATTTTATAAVTTASATVTSAPETTPAPESSAPTESETKTEPDSSTAADDSSEEQHFHILYPDLRGSLSVDNGLLDMNYSLFGLLLVALLAALVLALRHEARGQVRHADGGVGGVHALAAVSSRAEDVDAQVLLGDVDVVVRLVRLREHDHRRGARVDAPLCLGLRHALHAVSAALETERAVGAVALYREEDFLVAVEGGLVRAHHVDLPAVRLTVAGVHAEEVARKQRRLVAARPRAHFEHRVASF